MSEVGVAYPRHGPPREAAVLLHDGGVVAGAVLVARHISVPVGARALVPRLAAAALRHLPARLRPGHTHAPYKHIFMFNGFNELSATNRELPFEIRNGGS